MSGTQLMECEGKVNGLCLRLVMEFTLSGEGRTFLIRSEHEHALQQIYIGNFISNHQWIKIIPHTQQKMVKIKLLRGRCLPTTQIDNFYLVGVIKHGTSLRSSFRNKMR